MLDDDVLDETVVTCVEWGDTVRAALPVDHLECEVGVDGPDAGSPRFIVLHPSGPAWFGRTELLREACTALARTTDGLALIVPGGDA
jgi:tRNA A37 threonylcarbamoyladenosine biosynthesis protein TsaE